MHPRISICVIDMPMSIYQLCEGVRAQVVESCCNSRSRYCEPRVDQQLAVLACQDRDISTRALENTDVATKRVNFNLGSCCLIDHRPNDAGLLCKEEAGGKSRSGGGQTRYGYKTAAGEGGQVYDGHGLS